jgi:hypothetical protein
VYVPLKLRDNQPIRYNSVINKIGKVDVREISHSNTFSIPYVYQNIEALRLNDFNVHELAVSLNKKYDAKYYKEGILLQVGFLVVNGSDGDSIKLNFIDGALELTQIWGSTPYIDLLRSGNPSIPEDYQTLIEEMREYTLANDAVAPPLSKISLTEDYGVALFPNSLNCIGDKFQKYYDDARPLDAFNPYQSRPIFNAYAFMNIICEAYGYTPIFNESIDWDIIKKTYMVADGLNKSEQDVSGIQTTEHDTISTTDPHYSTVNGFGNVYSYQTAMEFPVDVGIAPNSVDNFPSAPLGIELPAPSFFSKRSLFVPDITETVGTITFTAMYQTSYFDSELVNDGDFSDSSNWATTGSANASGGGNFINNTNSSIAQNFAIGGSGDIYQLEYEIVSTNGGQLSVSGAFSTTNIPSDSTGVFRVSLQGTGGTLTFNNNSSFVGEINNISLKKVYHPIFAVWKNSTDGLAPIIEPVPTSESNSSFLFINSTVDKNYFDDAPAQADPDGFIGMYIIGDQDSLFPNRGKMTNMQVTETISPPGYIAYDPDSGEFLQENIDLTYATPKKNITTLLTGLMHKEGMLMNIDHTNKEVEFFSYSYYKTQVNNGEYYDWTKYLQEYINPNFNTQYGSQYAITNRLGLSSPYLGNTIDIVLGNQSSQSKYKDFKKNSVKNFKDVKKVDNVNISGSVSYVEYAVEGLSLVEHEGDLGDLDNLDWDKNNYGTLSNLPYIQNVNFTIVPDGVSWWYNLIDTAVRAKPTFLLPVNIASKLDLRKPIYVGQLGGFYILEELEGYEDSSTPVRAKLIKIPDIDATTLASADTNPSITIIGSSWRPQDLELVPIVLTDVYLMMTSTNFNNYIPTSATMYAEKLTGSGGTATGTILSSSIILNQQGNYEMDIATIEASDPITSSEEGYYKVYVEDQDGLRSNEVELKLGEV